MAKLNPKEAEGTYSVSYGTIATFFLGRGPAVQRRQQEGMAMEGGGGGGGGGGGL